VRTKSDSWTCLKFTPYLVALASALLVTFHTPSFVYARPGEEAQKSSMLTSYTELSTTQPAETTLAALPGDQLAVLYQTTLVNPVSHFSQLTKYDPTGIVGFCFGRAMTAHLTARKEFHVKPTAIYKLFVIGDLRSVAAKPEWRFHVTTILPVGTGGRTKWMAIDPIMRQPLSVAEWMTKVRRGWDSWHGTAGGKARFFLVSNEAILPDIRILPEPETGERIIELNFVPETAGIRSSEEWATTLGTNDTIYALSETEMNRFFLVADSKSPKTMFSFSGIKINDQYIPYNNYFADLLATFTVKRVAPSQPLMSFGDVMMTAPAPDPAAESLDSSPAPMGFDLSRLLKTSRSER